MPLSDKYVVEYAMHTADGAFASGAFGVVYTGRRRSDGAPVAIKFSKCGDGPRVHLPWNDLFASAEQRPLLLEEPIVHRAASALGHPNICRLHDVYEEALALPELVAQQFDRPGRTNRLVMVLDLLTGRDLYDVLASGIRPAPVLAPQSAAEPPRSRPFNEVDKRNMFAQVASAVAALHAADIVHRDIKPHNIVMRSPPEPGVTPALALIDFGLAIQKSRGAVRAGRTGIIGTKNYAAPELFVNPRGYSGKEAYDTPIDVYALGVVCYLMLMGFHDSPEDFPFSTTGPAFPDHVAARALSRLRFLDPTHEHHARAQALSPQSQDLLKRMLDPSPHTRITAAGILAHPWITATPPQLLSAASQAHHDKVPYGFAPKRRDMNVRLLASVAAGQCKANLERFHGVQACLAPGDLQRIYRSFHALVVRREMQPSALYTPPSSGPRLVAGLTREGMTTLLSGEHVQPQAAALVVQRVFEELDKDRDGLVRWKEFLAVLPLLAHGPVTAHFPEETLRLFWDIWCDASDGAFLTPLFFSPPLFFCGFCSCNASPR